MTMLSLNGSVKATSTLSFSGVGYYRWFDQKHDDGNIAESGYVAVPASAPRQRDPAMLCFDDATALDDSRRGYAITNDDDPIDRRATSAFGRR